MPRRAQRERFLRLIQFIWSKRLGLKKPIVNGVVRSAHDPRGKLDQHHGVRKGGQEERSTEPKSDCLPGCIVIPFNLAWRHVNLNLACALLAKTVRQGAELAPLAAYRSDGRGKKRSPMTMTDQ